MAAGDLLYLSLGSGGHHPLRRRRDHLVLGGDEIVARLRLPSGLGHGSGQGIEAPRHLRVGHERCEVGLHVRGERSRELCAIEKQITVLRRQDWRHGRTRRRIRNQRGHRLARIGRKRRDIDEPRDPGVIECVRPPTGTGVARDRVARHASCPGRAEGARLIRPQAERPSCARPLLTRRGTVSTDIGFPTRRGLSRQLLGAVYRNSGSSQF